MKRSSGDTATGYSGERSSALFDGVRGRSGSLGLHRASIRLAVVAPAQGPPRSVHQREDRQPAQALLPGDRNRKSPRRGEGSRGLGFHRELHPVPRGHGGQGAAPIARRSAQRHRRSRAPIRDQPSRRGVPQRRNLSADWVARRCRWWARRSRAAPAVAVAARTEDGLRARWPSTWPSTAPNSPLQDRTRQTTALT